MNWDFSTGTGEIRSFSRVLLELACARTQLAPFFRSPEKWVARLAPATEILVSLEVRSLEEFDQFNPNDRRHRLLAKALAEYLDKTAAAVFQMNPYPKVTLAGDNYYGQKSQIPPYDDDAGFYIGLASPQDLDILMERPGCQSWQQYLRPGDLMFKGEQCMIYGARWIGVNYEWFGAPVVFGAESLFAFEYQSPIVRCVDNLETRLKRITVCGAVSYDADPTRIIHLRKFKRQKGDAGKIPQVKIQTDILLPGRRKIDWR